MSIRILRTIKSERMSHSEVKVVGYMGWSDIMDPGRQFYLRRSVAFCPVMKERFL